MAMNSGIFHCHWAPGSWKGVGKKLDKMRFFRSRPKAQISSEKRSSYKEFEGRQSKVKMSLPVIYRVVKHLGQTIRRPHLLQCERLVLRWFDSVGLKQGTEWLRDPLNSSRRIINWCYMMISLDILSISNPVTPSPYHNAMELFFFSAALWSLYQLLHNAPHLAVGPKAMGDGVTNCNNHLTTTNGKRGCTLLFGPKKPHHVPHSCCQVGKWSNSEKWWSSRQQPGLVVKCQDHYETFNNLEKWLTRCPSFRNPRCVGSWTHKGESWECGRTIFAGKVHDFELPRREGDSDGPSVAQYTNPHNSSARNNNPLLLTPSSWASSSSSRRLFLISANVACPSAVFTRLQAN